MTLPVLGMDVSKKKFHVVLVGTAARSLQHEFSNRASGFAQLATWLRRQPVDCVHACLEATGVYGEELARFLHQTGHRVSVVNPRQIRAFAASELARNKNRSAGCRSDGALLSSAPSSGLVPAARPSTCRHSWRCVIIP